MINLKQIYDLLINKYPIEAGESWDFNGFSYTVSNWEEQAFTGATFALDVTKEVMQYAIDNGHNLIVTHHPFIFNEDLVAELEMYPYKQEILKLAKKHKINILALHTNFDAHEFGTSFWAAKKAFPDLKVVKPLNYAAYVGTNMSLANVLEVLKSANLKAMAHNCDEDEIFNRIWFFAGSGDSQEIVKNAKVGDLVITSDISWHEWILYSQTNTKVIQVSHQIEEVALAVFKVLIDDFCIKINQDINWNEKNKVFSFTKVIKG